MKSYEQFAEDISKYQLAGVELFGTAAYAEEKGFL